MLKGCDIEVIAFIFLINEDESLFVISESLLTTCIFLKVGGSCNCTIWREDIDS